jgi:hypothetical protein
VRGEGMRTRSFPVVSARNSSHAAGRVVWVCALWALVHSVLASTQAKDLTCRVVGVRYRDGLYRLAFNAQSVVSLVWAARWFSRLPDHELYRARLPWSWLFRAGPVASLGVLLSGIRVVGLLDFAGITPLWKFLTVSPPAPIGGPCASGSGLTSFLVKSGAFHFTRHPGNLGALGFFLFLPRMTANRAVLTALVALYVVLGSLHEEHRLRAAYGAAYERYRRSVPFLIPRPSRR